MKKISTSKAIFNSFMPEPVFYIVAYDKKHQRSTAMLSTWTTKCSSHPFIFSVALWKKGYTQKLVSKEKEFVIAIPGKKLISASNIFSKFHGDKIDKFKKAKIKTEKAKFVKPVLLSDAIFNFECKVIKKVEVGDHFIFFGEVKASHVNENLKNNNQIILNYGFTKNFANLKESGWKINI